MKHQSSNGTVRIFSARACKAATQFMDFLVSPEARRFYEKYGWCVAEE